MLSRTLITLAVSLFGLLGFVSSAWATCPTGQVECNGECVDLKKDEDNCGKCGATCGRAQSCSQGACRLECPDVQTACGDVCVTVASDPSHCGGCGRACASNQYCSMGQCQQATCPKPKEVKTGTPDTTTTTTTKTH